MAIINGGIVGGYYGASSNPGDGSGFLFGTGTSIFANDAARDTYFTTNPGQLDQYEDNPFLLIQVGTGFQRRVSSTWVTVTSIVRGPKGDTPNRQVRGQLLATATFPAGEHVDYAQATWALESGIPSGIALENSGAFTNANLNIDKNVVSNTQVGWFFEFVENETVIRSGIASTLATLGASPNLRGAVNDLLFFMFMLEEQTYITFNFEVGDALTVPNGSSYQLKIYIAEN